MTSIAEGEAELQGYGGSCAVTWPCGLMDKALVFGTKNCRFESCQCQACSGEHYPAHSNVSRAPPGTHGRYGCACSSGLWCSVGWSDGGVGACAWGGGHDIQGGPCHGEVHHAPLAPTTTPVPPHLCVRSMRAVAARSTADMHACQRCGCMVWGRTPCMGVVVAAHIPRR